ncbi:MAG: F0F1 ATP synthase subunit delta [Alphaproteobacteria bacterium]|nr:F0F1 ATP synthase subunit delta [Alphaproteobacteria bacterium]
MASETTGLTGLAERYAAALYELAEAEKSLDAVADDLRRLRDLIGESTDLARLIRSPVLSRADQVKAITAVLAKANELTRCFVGTVAQNRRLFALGAMIKAYLAELAGRRGEIAAEVTSARKLSDAQVSAVTDNLRKVVGAKISVDLKVDPALIGGLVVRVGSRMVDSSIRTKLQRLQLAMKGVA